METTSNIFAAIDTGMLAMPELGALYVGCLVFGGGMVLLSSFGGHHDGIDAPAHMDFGAHGDMLDVTSLDPAGADADFAAPDTAAPDAGDATHGSPAISMFAWFSLRFLVYFVATFGAVGTVLTYMSDLRRRSILVISLIAGLAVGQIVHWIMRSLMRSDTNSQTSTRDLLNRPARVTVAIAPGRRGQIAVPVRESEIYLTAVALRSEERFAIGDRVIVREYSAGTAAVISRQEHAFRQETGERADT